MAFSFLLHEVPEGTEVEVQILVFQPEGELELVHALGEREKRLPQSLHLLGAQPAALDPAERLTLHQLAEQLDDREDELRETLVEVLRVGADPPAKAAFDPLEFAAEQGLPAFG